jgi:protein-L-isoaspartate(D-aspartate) O-methyltransferase
MTPRPSRFPAGLARVSSGANDKAVPLRAAAKVNGEAPANTGFGLDSASVRSRMVDRLRREGIGNLLVLDALNAVPRHQFVDSALVTQAYEDTSLPIGHGQTISKPSVVARMLELLFDTRAARQRGSWGRVLEIGTGCGYQAALLSSHASLVISVERLRPLHEKARELLAPMRRNNLRLVYGDGHHGHAPNAPYDAIIAAAGGDALPQAWLDQMAVGGRLVAPMRAPQGGQVLTVVDRTERTWVRRVHEAVHFVPLKSGVG